MGTGQQAWQESVFLDGTFQRPAQGWTLPVRDKASGEIFGLAGLAGAADADVAVAAALPAQRAWSGRTYAERAGLLRAAAAVLDGRAREWRELIMRETGASGLGGRSGGDANLEEFTQRRWLTVAPGPVHYPY